MSEHLEVLKSIGFFDAGEVVMFEGKQYIIVDFEPATDQRGQLIYEEWEAWLYDGRTVILSRINTKLLKKI